MTPTAPDPADVAKVLATRHIIAQATDEQLRACRDGYARVSNNAAREIVRLCEDELSRRPNVAP